MHRMIIANHTKETIKQCKHVRQLSYVVLILHLLPNLHRFFAPILRTNFSYQFSRQHALNPTSQSRVLAHQQHVRPQRANPHQFVRLYLRAHPAARSR